MTQPDTSMGVEKPPLGIMPRSTHDKIRALDLLDAICRYSEAGLKYPQAWLEEVRDYVERY